MKKFLTLSVVAILLLGCQPTKMPVSDEVAEQKILVDNSKIEQLKDFKPEGTVTYEDFLNETYGIKFQYPKGWNVDQSDSEAVFQVSISNMVPRDDFSCEENYAWMRIVSTVRDNSKDFDGWIADNYHDVPFLDSFGGAKEKIIFLGYPAYKFGEMGFETYCPSYGYVVDISNIESPDRIIEIVISRNPNYLPGAYEIEKVLKSIVLTGS